jgi:hypothetical protein
LRGKAFSAIKRGFNGLEVIGAKKRDKKGII